MDAINSRGIGGYDGKLEVPAVIMSFGEEYDQLSDEIYNLLENELKPYNVQEELAWMKTLKNRKGKYKTADEIKRMIHCIGMDDTGISFE